MRVNELVRVIGKELVYSIGVRLVDLVVLIIQGSVSSIWGRVRSISLII